MVGVSNNANELQRVLDKSQTCSNSQLPLQLKLFKP